MNTYLVAVYHYFRGYQNFEVISENKADALRKVKEEVRKSGGGNYNLDSARVVKKLQV